LRYFLFPILVTFFLGCSQKNYTSKESYLITFKSKELKFSDMGFISKNDDSILVDIFSVGNQVLKLEMGSFISVNDGVPTPYSFFNKKVFQSEYPSKTVKYIFSGSPIFDGKNLEKTSDGFSQHIGENILYKVSKKSTYFKDKMNGVLIKIVKLK